MQEQKKTKKHKQSRRNTELAKGIGRQRGRWSFREICRCAAGLRLDAVVTSAALFSH